MAGVQEQRVLGYFEVEGISEEDPGTLWERYAAVGEIGHEAFQEYYQGASRGVAIHVGRVQQLEDPVPLGDVVPNAVPPQSFVYARPDAITELENLAAT
jgi:predicted transcriptional regulator